MEHTEPMVFKLALKKIPIQLEHTNGDIETFTIEEFGGQAREQFLTSMNKRMSGTGDDLKITNFEGMNASLICKCMRDKAGKLVSKEVVDKWKATVVADLFKACQTLNGLNKTAEKDAKNDLAAKKEPGSVSPTDSESQSND